jgi:hypothetical protein
MLKKLFFQKKVSARSTVEEHSTNNPKIEGLNPITSTGRELLALGERK